MFSRLTWQSVLANVLVLMLVSACSGLATEPEIVSTLLPRSTAEPVQFDAQVSLQEGAAIFAENCVRCHGATGKGDGELVQSGQVKDIPDFTNPVTIQEQSLETWFDTISNGRIEKLMPPWKDALTLSERWSVALYSYTLSYSADKITKGEQIYRANCIDCHGVDGSGTDQASGLWGLISYTEKGLIDRLNAHQSKLALESGLSDADVSALTQYLRILSTREGKLAEAINNLPSPAVTEDVISTSTSAESTNAEAQNQTIGILRGQIKQGTAGGTSPEGLEAVLHIFDGELNEQLAEFIVDADGHYQYDEVVIDPNFAYLVTVQYQDLQFNSQVVLGDTEISDMVLDVTIYEPTNDASMLEVTSRATQINLLPENIYVIEVLEISNTSDHMYLLEQGVSLSFPIPDNTQVQISHTDPNRFTLNEDSQAVEDSYPVLPGEGHYVQYAYSLPVTDSIHISQPISYPTNGTWEFYVDSNHLSFAGDKIEFARTQSFNNLSYSVYEVSSIPPPGENLAFSISLTAPTQQSSSSSVSREVVTILFIVLGIALIAGAGVLVWHERKKAGVIKTDDSTVQAIMQAIAALDNRYEAGEIDKASYENQLQSLKNKLMQKMKSEGSSR